MSDDTLFEQVLNPANRANPYPIYARLRETPISRQADGTYVVSTYQEIHQLLHDPRISSEDLPDPPMFKWTGHPIDDLLLQPIRRRVKMAHRPLIFQDPPNHDKLRGLVMRVFSVDRVRGMRQQTNEITNHLLEKIASKGQFDLVDDFSYPLPVTVICEMLGVPAEDEPLFQGWATQLATFLEPDQRHDEENRKRSKIAFAEISAYVNGLIKKKRSAPKDDILSDLSTYDDPKVGRMDDYDLVATTVLLLIAGHETTVNLITNGMLTMLRFPETLEALRSNPEMAPRLIEELLRFEPPIHYRTRKATADIAIAGTIIPKGAPVVLLLASANRDPLRFPAADRFDPNRTDNQHFGFGGSLHYCVGAPLARIEAEVALVALAQRLVGPRLLENTPEYRPGAALRGPAHLRLAVEGVTA